MPKHEPTEKSKALVEGMAMLSVPISNMCKLLKISRYTLRQHYRDEIESGRRKAFATIRSALAKRALSGDPQAALIFFGGKTCHRPKKVAPTEAE